MNPVALFIIAAGSFSILGAICNWDWFMNSRKAEFMVRILTRNGARIFYAILGILLVVLGVLACMGIVDMGK